MKSFFILTVAVAVFFSCGIAEAQVIGNSGGGWSVRGIDPIRVFYSGKLVAAYNSGKKEGKPFFYPVIGPTGENMTRHWPMEEGFKDEATDHIHHRGMWYGLGNVNGLDFWHFSGDPGKKDHQFGSIVHKSLNGVSVSQGAISIKTKSDWVELKNPKHKICSDKRMFTFRKEKNGTLIVDAEITLIADSGDVIIHDDKEGAWAIRTIPTLRLEGPVAKGTAINSEGQSGKDVWGKRADWVDYYGPDRAGNEVGIAMLDHPSNLRHPTWWHARHYGLVTANPFGQEHFEKGVPEDAGKYVIHNGDSLTFRYRTIFHRGNVTDAGIAEAYHRFAGQ